MFRRLPMIVVAVVSVVCAFLATDAAARAQAVPVPVPTLSATPTKPATPKAKPTTPPNTFTYGGTLRLYNFVRHNAQQNSANPNRTAFAPGGSLNTEYTFNSPNFKIGTTYFGSDTFGWYGRDPQPQFNSKLDNTLPASALATFLEAYVTYGSPGISGSIGDKVWNYLWAPSSDSRLKPAAYQGLDLGATIVKGVTVGVTRIIRFENRTSSNFTRNTLLTSQPLGNSAGPVIVDTSGALRADLTATVGRFVAHAENYSFYDLANLTYADAKYTVLPTSPFLPYVALQYAIEHQTGKSYLGRISNNTIGFQIGANLARPSLRRSDSMRRHGVTATFLRSPPRLRPRVFSCRAGARSRAR